MKFLKILSLIGASVLTPIGVVKLFDGDMLGEILLTLGIVLLVVFVVINVYMGKRLKTMSNKNVKTVSENFKNINIEGNNVNDLSDVNEFKKKFFQNMNLGDFEKVSTNTQSFQKTYTTSKTFVNGKEVSNNSDDNLNSEQIEDILKTVNNVMASSFGNIVKSEEKSFIDCEYCGSTNEPSEKKCSSCGANLKRKK